MKQYAVCDRDFAAFVIYAVRERSLDALARQHPCCDIHQHSIAALRELNKKLLFKETRH